MLSVVCNKLNKITVYEDTLDRDGNIVYSFNIGSGYGIFTSLSRDNVDYDKQDSYSSNTILIKYISNPPDPSVVAKPKSTEPRTSTQTCRYRCVWRDKSYDVTEVQKKYDIRGNFIGYRIYSSNE